MSEPRRYRKMPVVIEAMQWSGSADAATPIIDWILSGGGTARWHEEKHESLGPYRADDINVLTTPEHIAINTLEGVMRADVGDYIIRGVQGEFYPCKPDIFESTYEEVGDD